MAFSTDSPLPKIWRFSDIHENLVADLFKCSIPETKQLLARIHAQHRDPGWVGNTLATLPAPALALLSVLTENDGMLDENQLVLEVGTRFGVSRREFDGGVVALLRQLLVVPLRLSWGGQALALVEPAANTIVGRVVDLDLAPLPAGPFVPRSDDRGRTLLAVSTALGHVELKLTAMGLPHRGGVKRIAKQLGLAEDVLENVVKASLCTGLLTEQADTIVRPNLAALVDAAEGRFADEPVLAALRDRLVRGPLAVTLVGRWLDRCARVVDEAAGIATDHLEYLPGFTLGAIGNIAAITHTPLEGSAAASITPSFEVFLPPESRPVDIVHVVACAELVRVDRVIVARLTKASITRAVATGATADDLLAKLTSASRTPVPQNVAAAIRDWATGATHAVIATGRVIVVPTTEADRVRGALSSFSPRTLAPGVFLIDETISQRLVTAALAKIGITERTSSTATQPGEKSAPITRTSANNLLSLPTLGSPGDLHTRIEAWRRGDPDERKKLLVLPVAKKPPTKRIGGDRASDDDDDADDADDADVIDVSEETERLLETWERRNRVHLAEEEFIVAAALFDVSSPHDRRFALAATTIAELNERIGQLLNRGGLSKFLAKPAVKRVLPGMVAALSRPPTPPTYDFQRHHLVARLDAAARTRSTLVLDLGGSIRTVAVSRILQRGTVWMLLGEDTQDESTVAIPITTILGVADPSLDTRAPATPAPAPSTASRPWRPVEGDVPPAGHVRCPCGSGQKYRSCCRDVVPN